MSRYIDADKLIRSLAHYKQGKWGEYETLSVFELESAIENFADTNEADVQEVRHGRWISLTPPEMRTYETDVYFMCSECKNAVRFIANDLPYEHCPHCLARCEK